jgi:Sin3 histone deacetylase corepressor complex component SDS3
MLCRAGHSSGSSSSPSVVREVKIENGKLFYEKRWFRRGQTVHVESASAAMAAREEAATYEAVISAVGNEAIWVRRQEDSSKQKICISQLIKGKILLKRRAP